MVVDYFHDYSGYIDFIFEQLMEDKKAQEMKEDIASEMRKKDYYDILGIKKTATDA